MAKIVGVAKKPRIRKKDGLSEWKVWFTPYSGARKKWSRIIAKNRIEAWHKLNVLKSDYLHKRHIISDNCKPSDFDHAYVKLMDGLKADNVGNKCLQRCSNVFDRMFREFQRKKLYRKGSELVIQKSGKSWRFRKERFPEMTSFDGFDLRYYTEYLTYYCNEIGTPQGKPSEDAHAKMVIKRLRNLGYIPKDVYLDVMEMSGTPNKNVRGFNTIPLETIDKLLKFIRKQHLQYYRLLTLLRWTGRRIEEVCCYKKADVVMSGLIPVKILVRGNTVKAKCPSEIPLVTEGRLNPIGEVVKDAMRGNRSEWLFVNRMGKKCKQNDVRRFLAMWSKRVIGEHVYPHLFCKLYGTYTQDIGDKARVALAGRKDAKVMDRHYANITDESMAKVLAKMGWK